MVQIGENLQPGDRVIATVDLGHGIRSGTTGVVTHVSTFHGLLTVRFERHGELTAIKLHQVAHA
jgi:hypothetical protein